MLGGKNDEIISFAPVRAKIKSFKGTKKEVVAVSYTHLTLPTKLEV